jgi:hypothetical protein
MDKKFYLSGPMSNIEHHNFPAFDAACETLRRRGLSILSPHEVAHDHENGVVGSLPWNTYLHRDLLEMLQTKCTGIILLPGWSKSNGAKLELQLALGLGYDVYFYRYGELISMERS